MSPVLMDDSHELAQRASAGDEEAIEALMARHMPGLRAFLRLRMGPELRSKESASDLAQSTCREILQHMDRYQYRGADNFRHWLYATAQRKLKNRVEFYRADKRDAHRERGQHAARSDDDLAALYQTLSTPSRGLMRREWMEALEASFEKLAEPHREVIVLSRVVGLPHEEVAKSMGRSVLATRSLLHRALAELAEYMQPDEDG